MRVTAILNLKGGVAKTVTTVNMAAILARENDRRVLVIDADSQCNTTDFFGGCEPRRCTLSDLLKETDVNRAIRPSSFDGIDLLPADNELMDLDLSKVENRQVDILCLQKLRREIGRKYDNVLIDCPPAFNAASAAALLAADDVIIPIKLDAFAIQGMANLMRQIENMKKVNPKLTVAGILPVMWYKAEQITEAENAIKASGLPLFTHVRRSPTVDAMTYAQEPLLLCSPKSGALRDYRRVTAQYLKGGERNV